MRVAAGMIAALALVGTAPTASAQDATLTQTVEEVVTTVDGVVPVPSIGVIPVPIAGGDLLPPPGSDPGAVIPISPSTDDTKLCMVALADLEAVRQMVRSARRAVRRRPTAKRRRALSEAKALRVEARAAKRESCL